MNVALRWFFEGVIRIKCLRGRIVISFGKKDQSFCKRIMVIIEGNAILCLEEKEEKDWLMMKKKLVSQRRKVVPSEVKRGGYLAKEAK